MSAATVTRERASFARRIDRQWQKGPPASMPKHWREVCDAALTRAPRLADDPLYHRAVVAALRFAKPRRTPGSATTNAWAADPFNAADLALSMHSVLAGRTVQVRS